MMVLVHIDEATGMQVWRRSELCGENCGESSTQKQKREAVKAYVEGKMNAGFDIPFRLPKLRTGTGLKSLIDRCVPTFKQKLGRRIASKLYGR